MARALDHGAARVHGQPPGARGARAARASPQCSGTAVSAAWVGVEQLTAATSSISVRSVWWPTDAMTGTRSSATVRHSVSSQKAKRSASEPPPRATTTTSTSSDGGQVLQRAGDGRRGVAVLHRGEGPHHPPGPAAAVQAGEHVVARLAALAGHHADAARQRRARQALLGLEQPLGRQRPAQDLDLGEQVALAGEAQAADGERERRRRRARARVVVRARRRRRPARRRTARPAAGAAPRRRRATSSTARRPRRRAARTTRGRARRAGRRPRRTAARGRVCAARRAAWPRRRRPGTGRRAGNPRCPRGARADRPSPTTLAGAEARPTALQSRTGGGRSNRLMALPDHRADTVARLTGLLEVTRLVRSEQDLDALLPAIAAAVSEAMGYGRSSSRSTARPGTTSASRPSTAPPEGREALLGRERTWSEWEPLFDLRFESPRLLPAALGPVRLVLGRVVSFVPDIEMADGPDAWHPEDALFVPAAPQRGAHARDHVRRRAGLRAAPVRRRPRGARRAGRPRRPGRAGHAGRRRGRAPPHGARAAAARVRPA